MTWHRFLRVGAAALIVAASLPGCLAVTVKQEKKLEDDPDDADRQVYSLKTARSMSAAKDHGLTFLAVRDLREAYSQAGVKLEQELRAYEVALPEETRRLLERNAEASLLLPIRVTVYNDGKHTRIGMVFPTADLRNLGDPELRSVAEDIEDALISLINETVG